jgi:hypothetical protein
MERELSHDQKDRLFGHSYDVFNSLAALSILPGDVLAQEHAGWIPYGIAYGIAHGIAYGISYE